jgi:drug/metabolite transporter (DMT)-like permease
MEKQMWWVWAVLAGLAWGTYVPFVSAAISGLQNKALASFLCVGVAYFLIAVLYPVGMFASGSPMPNWNSYGITMATLAGVAGAFGALCVILANGAARSAYPDSWEKFRLYIAPIIFALAPVLNALISMVWHPTPAAGAFNFEVNVPGWKLWVGIVLTGIGAALVLYSKEEAEAAEKARHAAERHAIQATAAATPQVHPEAGS